jgi:hypothetical protein
MATSTLGNGTLVLAGTTSGTTTVTATAVAGTTTLTLPETTYTVVGKATTDTLTNKTLTGAAMNGTLGATTPSTVAATTISASSTATFAAGAAGTPSITTTGDTNTGIFFPAADTIGFAEGGAEVARFDSSGNLGIGTTSPAAKLNIVGGDAYFHNTANLGGIRIGYDGSNYWSIQRENASTGRLGFFNGTSEKVSIDPSGNLLVGTTSGSFSTFVKDLNGNAAFGVTNSGNSTPNGVNINFSGATPNNATQSFLFAYDSTSRAIIYSNGGLANYSANNSNLSDRREKTNFAPAKSYLDVICAIPIQTFNYIDQNLEEDGGLTLGVVAQDVQAVAPELVMESNKGTKEEPKMRLSIYQTDLQYALMKCIQEQQALIESLTTRLTALENK